MPACAEEKTKKLRDLSIPGIATIILPTPAERGRRQTKKVLFSIRGNSADILDQHACRETCAAWQAHKIDRHICRESYLPRISNREADRQEAS